MGSSSSVMRIFTPIRPYYYYNDIIDLIKNICTSISLENEVNHKYG